MGVLSGTKRDFIHAACDFIEPHLTTFPVHLLYHFFYSVSIRLGWVGVVLSEHAPVDIR